MKKQTKDRLEHEAEGSVAGALAGATLGAFGGLAGAAVGAALGAAAGALAGFAVEKDDEKHKAEDDELNREIGVSGGDIGAPNLEHPDAKVGAYSGSGSGAPPSASGALR
jgi:uncharacterized protein YcfJ